MLGRVESTASQQSFFALSSRLGLSPSCRFPHAHDFLAKTLDDAVLTSCSSSIRGINLVMEATNRVTRLMRDHLNDQPVGVYGVRPPTYVEAKALI
jgi:hypothetical protein